MITTQPNRPCRAWRAALLGVGLLMITTCIHADPAKRILFIAGAKASHGYDAHAHRAGCRLLANALRQALPGVTADVLIGWPEDGTTLDGADAILLYCDGLGSHEINGHEEKLQTLTRRGVGLGFLHYAVVVPAGNQGDLLLDAMGGYYDPDWSVNPCWDAEFAVLPKHPVTRGVRPFRLWDEWYFHMRFRTDESRAAPILTALPPPETLTRADGPHQNNAHVRAAVLVRREPQHVAWVYERPNGGRGFGFTGGHRFWNFAHDDFRKVVLNAAAWLAHLDVPPEGVISSTPSMDEMVKLLGPPPEKWNRDAVERVLETMRPESDL